MKYEGAASGNTKNVLCSLLRLYRERGMPKEALACYDRALSLDPDYVAGIFNRGNALTALFPPAGLEASAIVQALKREFGSTVAGGQGQLKGKIFRIAHLGNYDVTDALGLLGSLEIALRRLGHGSELGVGMAAAEAEYLRREARA